MTIEEAEKIIERQQDALEQLRQWAEAYPLSVFPEPDLKLARTALEDAGLTLDAVSASAMRHVIKQTRLIVSEGLGGLQHDSGAA